MNRRIDHFLRAQDYVFDKAIKNPLSGIIPPVILGYITNNN